MTYILNSPDSLRPATAKGNRSVRNICQVGCKLPFESSGHLKKSPRLGFSVCSNWYSMKLQCCREQPFVCVKVLGALDDSLDQVVADLLVVGQNFLSGHRDTK